MRIRVPIALLILCPATARAQDRRPEPGSEPFRVAPDPWTKDDPKAFERLGYVAVGRMTFGDRHDSARMQEDLGQIPLIFLETAHFKLCCELPAQDVPRDKERRARLQDELEALAVKLPRLKPREVKTLDPWLRAHLFAQRLEQLESEFSTLLGVTDASFPPAGQTFYFRGDAPAQYRDPWMGRGPHLGLKGKFLVALFTKTSTCGRYLSTYTGAGRDSPSRWYFPDTDSELFATAIDFADGAYRDDDALHAHLVHNLVHCMIDAFRGYSYEVPSWWSEGLAHWFRRKLGTEHNDFEAIKESDKRAYTVFDWDEKVRQRADHKLVRPLDQIIGLMECTDFDLVDHMACWSRVDFLLSAFPRERFAAFVTAMKGCVDARGAALEPDRRLALQRDALQTAFGCDVDALDHQWLDWLQKRPRRR